MEDLRDRRGVVRPEPSRDASKIIVYTAPEGAEAATYTRGSARVRDGVARVALDPTFAWTTNPDVGLTVTVTPRGPASGLYVESLSTGELLVRCEGRGCADVSFDYLVWGLRIGFEEVGAVRPKDRDAAIPAMDSQQAIYAADPSLREHSPLERFRRTERAAGIAPSGSAPDLARAASLRASVGVFDPKTSRPVEPMVVESGTASVPAKTPPPRPELEAAARVAGTSVGPAAPALPTVPVAGRVEPGDVLAFDPLLAAARLSARSADPLVIGIVAQAEAPPAAGQAPIALAGTIASCRADATESPIVPGDLLVASAIPGHAMKAPSDAAAGTIVAKALEPLAAGTGTIRVLVMAR